MQDDAFVTEITPQSADFSPLVPRRRPQGRTGRLLAGQGLHGHPAVRLRDLGADPAAARPALQGDRPRQRLLPAVHSREPADARRRSTSRASRRRSRGSRRAATKSSKRSSSSGPTSETIFGAMYAEVDPVVARPARPHQPVGERRALGEGHAAVPAHDRVPLAGRAHRARDRRRGAGRDAEDARRSTRSSPRTMLAMPVVDGQKSESEKFAGAVDAPIRSRR